MMNSELNIYERRDGVNLARKIHKQVKNIKSGIVYGSCPICDYNNKNAGRHDFVIRDDGRYHCNSCGAEGMFNRLVRIVGVKDLPGYEVTDEKVDEVNNNEFFISEPKFGFKPNEDVIKKFSERGYSEEFLMKVQIHEYSNQNDCRYALPVRDINKRLVGFVFAGEDGKWNDGFGKQEPFLVGMGDCKNRCGVLVITVGIDNYAAVMQSNIRHDCVCVHDYKNPGLHGLRKCMDFISRYREIVIVSSRDYDKNDTCNAIEDLLSGIGKRILRTNIGDYGSSSDISECGTGGFVREIIESADECSIPGSSMIDGSDEYHDYVNSEKLPLDIKPLDYMMYGGLSFGAVHLISGETGNGKSVICCRAVLSAITKGYKCWIYSTEKSKPEFKGDLERMAVRPGMTVKKTNFYGREYHSISEDLRNDIRAWYGDSRMWFYDKRSVEDIIHNAELNIKINGVRVLIVDNLMTAMLRYKTVGNDKSVYELQARFVAALVNLAEQYNVCIILVAHKNKRSDASDTAGNNNAKISGASEIGNLAHSIISYDELNRADVERIKNNAIAEREKQIGRKLEKAEISPLLADIEWPERLIRLTKNRNGGELNVNGFWAYYNKETSRIYCCTDDLNVMYGWELPGYGNGRKTATIYGGIEHMINNCEDVEYPFPDTDESNTRCTDGNTKEKKKKEKDKKSVRDYEYTDSIEDMLDGYEDIDDIIDNIDLTPVDCDSSDDIEFEPVDDFFDFRSDGAFDDRDKSVIDRKQVEKNIKELEALIDNCLYSKKIKSAKMFASTSWQRWSDLANRGDATCAETVRKMEKNQKLMKWVDRNWRGNYENE